MTKRNGNELKVGDTIAIIGGPDTITALYPYDGSLAYLFPTGASIATFARARVGMTIDHSASFEVVA